MSMTDSAARNGVNTDALFATIDVVKQQRDLATFQFRATNTWITGTHSRGSITGFYGAGQDHSHGVAWDYDADHPLVLTGTYQGPTPVEYLLLGLAACLTAGLATIAAHRLPRRHLPRSRSSHLPRALTLRTK